MIRMLFQVLGPEHAGPIRRTVVLMTLAAIAEGLSYAFLVPVLTALFGSRPSDAWGWLLAFGAAVAGYAALRYLSSLYGFRSAAPMLRDMYHRFGDHLVRLPLGWFTASRVGEVTVLASRGVLLALSVVAHFLAPLIGAVVTPLTIVVVLAVYDWRLGLAAALAVPVVALIQRWTDRAVAGTDTDRAARADDAAGRVIEYIQAQPVLRAGGRGAQRFAILDDALTGVERAQRRATLSVLPGLLGLTLTVQAVFTALLFLAAYLALAGSIGAASVLAAMVLAARAADPLLSLAETSAKMRVARGELERLDALLRTAPLPEPACPVRPAHTGLEFDSVTFRRDGRTVLDNLSLTVPAGQRVAIVGPSGAGKSTMLALLARSYDVDAGAVRVGGADVRDIGTDLLLDQVTIVFQDVYLFDGTIEDNVRLGRPDADAEQVRAAAGAAGLDEVIARLPDGWHSTVGEGGAQLSGGERQRVSIARALLKNAPVVLLDEVTSALDPVNEAAVHRGIDRLAAGRTVVMVAHRLRTVQRADRIVFVDGGRIVEDGTHEELLARGGRYAQFWNLATVGA